jgi:hypothetical protein
MRTFLALLVSNVAIMFCTTPLGAQLQDCDDCEYYFGDESFAYCVLGGGGPFNGCYQEFQHWCSFESLCYPTEEDRVPELALAGGIVESRSSIGEATRTERRPCDGSAILRTYSAEDATARREALRRIVI